MSAGYKHSNALQAPTFWRAKYRHCQQARNIAKHSSHTPTREPRTGIVSKLETKQGTGATHSLESQGKALSTCWKQGMHYSHSLSGEPRIGIVSRLEAQQGTKATHQLENQSRHCQQARNTAGHNSHSLPEEPRTDIVSKLKTPQCTKATHFLESQGEALSAG